MLREAKRLMRFIRGEDCPEVRETLKDLVREVLKEETPKKVSKKPGPKTQTLEAPTGK